MSTVEVRYEWKPNVGVGQPVHVDLADGEHIITVNEIIGNIASHLLKLDRRRTP